MFFAKSYKFMLIATIGLSFVHTSEAKLYDWNVSDVPSYTTNNGIYLSSFLIGVIHGSLNKTSEYVYFKAQKNGVSKKDPMFQILTFISAHMIRLQLLYNKNIIDINTKNIVSVWWHGVGQALIESWDIETKTFTKPLDNLTLGVALAGLGGLAVQNFINPT